MITFIKKNVFFAIIMLGMLVSTSVSAQSKYYYGNITHDVKDVEQYGNIVNVEISFTLTDFKVKTLKSIDFTPVLSDGVNSIPLPAISFKGMNNYITYGRTLDLLTKKGIVEYNKKHPKYMVIDQSKATSGEIIYKFSLPFESWIKRAHVDVLKDLNCCGEERLLERSQIVEKVNLEEEIALYKPSVFVEYIEPKVEKVKKRSASIESLIEFKVGGWVLDPKFRNNKSKLDKLNNQINEIRRDRYTTIKGVSIAGYASPEGNSKKNVALSLSRTRSILSYIKKKVPIKTKLFKVNNVGEAWSDLREIIYNSTYDFRIDLLRIIDNEPNFAVRNREIARLNGGTSYRFLLDSVYPKLRKVVIDISFEVVPLDVDVAREVIKTRPMNLSLNEMYQVANSYGAGTNEFNEVFLIAQRIFPEDPIARINAASVRLLRGDLSVAEDYIYGIIPTEEHAEYYNVNGIIAMLNGLYTEAEGYFNTAKAMGLESADKNLAELYKIYRTVDEQELQRQRFAETQINPSSTKSLK